MSRGWLLLIASPSARGAFVSCLLVALGAGTALRFEALQGVLLADDYDHYAMHAGVYPVARSWLDFFDFVGGTDEEREALLTAGRLPWWTDPEIELAVLRPLSSALIAFDYEVLGGKTWLLHLHSMLWWGVLMLAVAGLYWRVLPRKVAAVAMLLYAVDESHALTVTWIANRSALVSVSLLTWGLLAHVEHRTRGLWGGLAPSVACVSLALLGGEHALAPLAYFFAFELLVMRDEPRSRLLALLPVTMLGAAYLAARTLLGYRLAGSGFYIDPLASPARFLSASVERLPLLLGDLWCGFGAEWFLGGPPFVERWRSLERVPDRLLATDSLRSAQIAVGVLSLLASALALAWLARRIREAKPQARTQQWLLAAALLSLVPMCATFPMSRLTLASAIGADALLAFVLCAAVESAWRARSWLRRTGLAAVAVVLLGVHVVYAAVRTYDEVAYYTARSRLEQDWVGTAEIDDRNARDYHIAVIASGDWTSQWAIPYVRHRFGRARPRSSLLLSGAFTSRHRIRRVLPNVFDLEILDPPIETAFAGSVYRPAEAAFVPGQRVLNPHFQVHVLETRGRQPTRIRFVFTSAPEQLRYAFLYPFARGLRRIDLPVVGGQLELPVPSPPRVPDP